MDEKFKEWLKKNINEYGGEYQQEEGMKDAVTYALQDMLNTLDWNSSDIDELKKNLRKINSVSQAYIQFLDSHVK
jgi:hypothetical protein